MKAAANKRIFFALWPDDTVRDHLNYVFKQAYQSSLPGRKLPATNFHLTLHFLGNVSAQMYDCVEKAAEQVTLNPFELRLDTFGAFAGARVFWSGMTGIPGELTQLQKTLGQLLVSCGYTPERRPFSPHVTLMRKVKCTETLQGHEPVRWQVDRFALVESVSVEGGVEYRPLRFYELGGDK